MRHLEPPFDLPAPSLILVGGGTQTLPGPGPAREVYCAPLTSARLAVAAARAEAYGAQLRIVTARGLVGADDEVSGPEPLLLEAELIDAAVAALSFQLDMLDITIIELHMSPQLESVVTRAVQALNKPAKITRPHLTSLALSAAFEAYTPSAT